MAYNDEYAILFEVDKCVKCRACTVACERWYQLDSNTLTSTADAVSSDDWVVPKAQNSVDNPPFVRYSCWHCNDAPCASPYQQGFPSPNYSGCPFGAVKIAKAGSTGSSNPGVSATATAQVTGAVYIDFNLCNPASPLCLRQCVRNCQRGGYPRVGTGSTLWTGQKAGKCMLCWDWISLQSDPALKKPVCVLSCPMKAMTYDTAGNIKTFVDANYPKHNIQDWGHVVWASKNMFSPPVANADPFVEDHISPLFDRVLSSSLGMSLAIPGAVLGALYALYRRKVELSPEAK